MAPRKYKITHATCIMFLLDVTGLDPQSAAALGHSILSRPHAVFLKVQKPPISLPMCLYSCYSISASQIVFLIDTLKSCPSLMPSSNKITFEYILMPLLRLSMALY